MEFVNTAQSLGINMPSETLRSLGEWLADRTAWPSDSYYMPRDAAVAVFEAYIGPGDADDTEELRVVCDDTELEWYVWDGGFEGWTVFYDEPHPELQTFVEELNRVLRG